MLRSVLSLLLLAAACSGAGPELTALRSDPVADLELESARRVSRSETDAGQSILDKPVRAAIQQTYEPADGYDPHDVLDEAITSGRAAGWDLQPSEHQDSFWQASRRFDEGRARLEIYLSEFVDPPRIVIALGLE